MPSGRVAGKERLFYTGSARIISDPRPSGLDMRVYACVSLHDGMSLLKKTGRGCYATFATLTAQIGCDAANLSRSLKRLVEWGYLTDERQDDQRRKTYRVTFESRDSWKNDQQSFVGETDNDPNEIVGNGESGNGGNPPQTGQHYSSLKGLYPSEEEKLNPLERARLAARGNPGKVKFSDNDGAQLAAFERAFRAESLSDERLIQGRDWLFALTDRTDQDDPNFQWAQRLYFDVDLAVWERGLQPADEAAHG